MSPSNWLEHDLARGSRSQKCNTTPPSSAVEFVACAGRNLREVEEEKKMWTVGAGRSWGSPPDFARTIEILRDSEGIRVRFLPLLHSLVFLLGLGIASVVFFVYYRTLFNPPWACVANASVFHARAASSEATALPGQICPPPPPLCFYPSFGSGSPCNRSPFASFSDLQAILFLPQNVQLETRRGLRLDQRPGP